MLFCDASVRYGDIQAAEPPTVAAMRASISSLRETLQRGEGAAFLLFDEAGGFGHAGVVQVGDDDVGAVLGEADRHGAAVAGGGAGDERDFAIEFGHGSLLGVGGRSVRDGGEGGTIHVCD